MKKIMLLFLLCSCGKTQLDQTSTSVSALMAPLSKVEKCSLKCSTDFSDCMKFYSASDSESVRALRIALCNNQKSACVVHCNHCGSVDWDINSPEVIPHQPTTCGPSNHGVQTCTDYQDIILPCKESDYN